MSSQVMLEPMRQRKPVPYSPPASVQTRFPRPSFFISCSSRSSSVSSSSSSGGRSTDEVPAWSSATSLAQSQSATLRRPLPQVPIPCQPSSAYAVMFSSSSSSPVASPSSAASPTGGRPRRALPVIPPPLPTRPHFEALPRNICAKTVLDLPTVVSASSSSDFVTPSYLRPAISYQEVQRAKTAPNVNSRPSTSGNAEASSSKIPMTSANVQGSSSKTPYIPKPLTAGNSEGSSSKIFHIARPSTADGNAEASSSKLLRPTSQRPQLRVQTTVHAIATVSNLRQLVPQQPLLKVELQTNLVMRRSSLDSMTARSSTLLTPDQALFPASDKRRSSRMPRRDRFSTSSSPARSPAVGSNKSRLSVLSKAGSDTSKLNSPDDYDGELSPMEFKPRGSGSGDEQDDQWVQEVYITSRTQAAHGSRTTLTSPDNLMTPTADEVFQRRLNKLRRRLGESMIREFGIETRTRSSVGSNKTLGRVVASEGEEDDTDNTSDDGAWTDDNIEDQMTFAASETVVNEDWVDPDLDLDYPPNMNLLVTPSTPPVTVISHDMSTMAEYRTRPPPPPPVLDSPETDHDTQLPSPIPFSHFCIGGDRCDGNCEEESRKSLSTNSSITESTTSTRVALKKKHFSRRWFKEKGGKRWEERDVDEVLGALRKLR